MTDRMNREKMIVNGNRFVATNRIVRFFFYIQLISVYRNLMELNFTILHNEDIWGCEFFSSIFCRFQTHLAVICNSFFLLSSVYFVLFFCSFFPSLIQKLHISFPLLCHQGKCFTFAQLIFVIMAGCWFYLALCENFEW